MYAFYDCQHRLRGVGFPWKIWSDTSVYDPDSWRPPCSFPLSPGDVVPLVLDFVRGTVWSCYGVNVTYPLRFHRQCEHCTHIEALSCDLWVPPITTVPTPPHGSTITASLNIPAVLPSQLPRINGWYTKTRLYHILCQAVPI
jgi:hypothetical protein